MSPNRADRILEEWSAVVRTVTPPPSPAEPLGPRVRGIGVNLVGVGLLVLALVVGLAWLGGRDEQSDVGDTAPPSSSAAPAPDGSSAVVPEPSATIAPSLNPCVYLSTPLSWEGAAGQRIAHVTLNNRRDGDCVLGEFERVQYVDAGNVALIEGPAPAGELTIPAHSSVSALIEIGNYCGPAPEQPVGFVFVGTNGGTFLVGAAEADADMSVPPCMGSSAPATIQMQPWTTP